MRRRRKANDACLLVEPFDDTMLQFGIESPNLFDDPLAFGDIVSDHLRGIFGFEDQRRGSQFYVDYGAVTPNHSLRTTLVC